MPVPVFLQNKRIQEQHHNMEIICITVIAVQNCGFRAYGLSTVLFSGVSTTSYLSAHPPGCCRGLPATPPPPPPLPRLLCLYTWGHRSCPLTWWTDQQAPATELSFLEVCIGL